MSALQSKSDHSEEPDDKILSLSSSQVEAIGLGGWIRYAGRPEDLSAKERFHHGYQILCAGFLAAWPLKKTS